MKRLVACSSALAGLLLAAPSFAAQGEAPVRWQEDARQERVQHRAVQQRLAQQPAWRAFEANHGPWRALWDEATGRPARMWGEGWDIDDALLATDAGAESIGWDVMEELFPLLGQGITLADLQITGIDRRAGITTVVFTQTWRGLPIESALISLRFKAGRFVMAQLESMPGIRLDAAPTVPPSDAVNAALAGLAWSPSKSKLAVAPSLVVLPELGENAVRYRLAWRMELESLASPSYRHAFVDAHDGSLVAWEEQVRKISGTVMAEHDNRWPQNGVTQSPMPLVGLSSNDGNGNADANGDFDLSGDGSTNFSWEVGSQWWDISTWDGNNLATFQDSLGSPGGTVLAEPAGNLSNGETRRVLAQLQAHVSAHIVRDWALGVNPNFQYAQQEVTLRVNRSDEVCNAWFDQDSTLNFVQQGSGCNNTGRLADVVYHEYGHGWHAWNIIQGVGQFDGALSEGLSDYVAATINNDAGMSPGFFTQNSNPLRDVEPNLSWPGDISNDTHITGLIIAGALWDLRKELTVAMGETAGVAHTDHLMWQITSRASDVPTSYAEALLADDNDGNLGNGTPNQCLIDTAFALHGLAEISNTSAFFIDHTPPADPLPAQQDVTIELSADLANPLCAEGDIESITVHWSTDADPESQSFQSVDMSAVGGNDWEAVVPGAPQNTLLRYRIELRDESGDVAATLPFGSVTDPWFGAWIGAADVLYEEDFEGSDGNYTHELISGPNQDGADDWGWGPAGGLAGDPVTAWSGNNIWGNDIVPEANWNGAYQPDVHNILRSPQIEVGDADPVFLQYRRWLTVEDGFWDSAELRVNGTLVWDQYGSPSQDGSDVHHDDFHWAFRSYDITDLVDSNGRVQVSWELISDPGLERGGWNIDDVRLIRPGDEPIGDDDDTVGDDDDDDDDTVGDDDDDTNNTGDDDDDSVGDDDDDSVPGPGPGAGNGEGAGFAVNGVGCTCESAGRVGGASPLAGATSLLLLGAVAIGRRRRW